MKHLMDMTYEEIVKLIEEIGEKSFRAKQIFQWLHKSIQNVDEMINVPIQLRKILKDSFTLGGVTIHQKLESQLDRTIKYLFLLHDANIIEGVLMKYLYGYTLCISSQVGCRMGCKFCASTLDGLVRNLYPGEMLDQVLKVNNDIRDENQKRAITNVVIMGSGEPLDNYVHTITFLKLLNHPYGLNISYRNISVSTCGVVPQIYRLADEGIPITLSISLHASNDNLRKLLIPIANTYSIADLLKVCKYFINKTGRRVIFEYALIKGVNDKESHAMELASILHGMQCHVNLIPLNSVKERDLLSSDVNTVHKFLEILKKLNISATRRREMGTDINGACGQLRRSYLYKDIL